MGWIEVFASQLPAEMLHADRSLSAGGQTDQFLRAITGAVNPVTRYEESK